MERNKCNIIGKMKNNEGITLLALAVTIVVLLILTSIGIKLALGNNGIIGEAKNAKEQAEIDEEKGIVKRATTVSLIKSKGAKVEQDTLEKALNDETGEGKTEVNDVGDVFEVVFIDSNRYYEVDEDGNISDVNKITKDDYAGDITKGGRCDGSEEKPYEINCIEDLCDFSNISNNITVSNKHIVLKRNLNFNSKFSYVNGNIKTAGKITSCDNADVLKIKLTTGEGFYNISQDGGNNLKNVIFDGQYHTISNLYENYEDKKVGGLFAYSSWGSKILNLTVTGIIKCNGNAGGIVGTVRENKIINCVNKCSVTGTGSVGGIAGNTYNEYSEFINCINYGDASDCGVLGWDWANGSKFYNCINIGNADMSATTSCIHEDSKIKMVNILNLGKSLSFISCRMENGIEKIINCYSLKGSTEKIVYSDLSWSSQPTWPLQIEEKNEKELKLQNFIDNMNNLITSGEKTEEIDMTGWAKWIIGTDGLPTLDLKTTWDGSEWKKSY